MWVTFVTSSWWCLHAILLKRTLVQSAQSVSKNLGDNIHCEWYRLEAFLQVFLQLLNTFNHKTYKPFTGPLMNSSSPITLWFTISPPSFLTTFKFLVRTQHHSSYYSEKTNRHWQTKTPSTKIALSMLSPPPFPFHHPFLWNGENRVRLLVPRLVYYCTAKILTNTGLNVAYYPLYTLNHLPGTIRIPVLISKKLEFIKLCVETGKRNILVKLGTPYGIDLMNIKKLAGNSRSRNHPFRTCTRNSFWRISITLLHHASEGKSQISSMEYKVIKSSS